jgi:hypothetical protein
MPWLPRFQEKPAHLFSCWYFNSGPSNGQSAGTGQHRPRAAVFPHRGVGAALVRASTILTESRRRRQSPSNLHLRPRSSFQGRRSCRFCFKCMPAGRRNNHCPLRSLSRPSAFSLLNRATRGQSTGTLIGRISLSCGLFLIVGWDSVRLIKKPTWKINRRSQLRLPPGVSLRTGRLRPCLKEIPTRVGSGARPPAGSPGGCSRKRPDLQVTPRWEGGSLQRSRVRWRGSGLSNH